MSHSFWSTVSDEGHFNHFSAREASVLLLCYPQLQTDVNVDRKHVGTFKHTSNTQPEGKTFCPGSGEVKCEDLRQTSPVVKHTQWVSASESVHRHRANILTRVWSYSAKITPPFHEN